MKSGKARAATRRRGGSTRAGAMEPAAGPAPGLEERREPLGSERALLDAVIETVPVGITVVDRDGNVVLANTEALRVLRQSVDAQERADWRETEAYDLDGRPVGRADLPLVRTLATGEMVRHERLDVMTGGGRVVVEISTAPVKDDSGGVIGAVAVLQDVTVRERQERAEREFVTNAAHELQSPLAGIISAIDVLQSGAKEKPERDVFLAHIEAAATRLARLVRALLILARAQTGYEAPKDELIAVRALLEDVASTVRPTEGVRVEIDCPDELAVLSNRELLEQAVANLADNAAKHTKAGRIVLCARGDGSVAEIAVVDTGPGIPAAFRPRAFERFVHGDSDDAGSGLGLPIVRAAVEALGGELELDSTVGAGTIVRIRISQIATLVKA